MADCNRADIVGRGMCSRCYQRERYQGRLDVVVPVPPGSCGYCRGDIPEGRRWGAKFCSWECKEKAMAQARAKRRCRPPSTATCVACGAAMPTASRSDARCCSTTCSDAYRRARRQAEKDAAKPPCPSCGGSLPPQRQTFCSDACRRKARRGWMYGITVAELDALHEAQADRCAICGTGQWGPRGSQVDHDHVTGVVRGVLCTSCNNGLGRFKDDPALLRAAADYLERFATG